MLSSGSAVRRWKPEAIPGSGGRALRFEDGTDIARPSPHSLAIVRMTDPVAAYLLYAARQILDSIRVTVPHRECLCTRLRDDVRDRGVQDAEDLQYPMGSKLRDWSHLLDQPFDANSGAIKSRLKACAQLREHRKNLA